MTEAERYARAVVAGEVITGKLVKLAADRFLKDLQRDDIVFDDKEAARAVNFIERKLRHWEGTAFRGKPLLLSDWQKFIVMQIFGWFTLDLHPTGVRIRRTRSVYIQIARKNGKTAFLAAIILYHIVADHEDTPQVLVGANNEDQAKICTNSVGQMVLVSPDLRGAYDDGDIKLSEYRGKFFALQYTERVGGMMAMSKNPETKDGYGASLGAVDEYHEAKDDKLLNVIESGQGSRINPLSIVITTAGFDKDGPCYSKLRDSSVKILNGTMEDDRHLAFIYEQDEGDDVADESTWVKSNPNWKISVEPDNMRAAYKKALNEGGTKMVNFLTKNLNRWVDAPVQWISTEIWNINKHPDNKKEELQGKLCYGGLDLARTVDLNAFVLWFPNAFGDKHAVLPFFWIPEAKVQNNNDHVDYRKWVEQGYMIQTHGNVADYRQIVSDIKNIISQYNFFSLSYDRYLMGHGVLRDLIEEGIQCHEIAQGYVSLSMPTNELERVLTAGTVEHFGNPVLGWMMGNTILSKDSSGNVKPNKAKSEKKIDGVAAMINSLAEWKTFENIDLTFTSI